MPSSHWVSFKLLRFALVPFSQTDFLSADLPSPRGRAVLGAVPVNAPSRRFVYRNREFAFTGFHDAGRAAATDPRFLIGRLAKHKRLGLRRLTESDVVAQPADDWIPIWIVIDLLHQYIAAEIHSDFGGLVHIQKVLEAAIAPHTTSEFRHEIVISPVTDPRRFWDVVAEYPLIYRLSLHFVSPNIEDTPKLTRGTLESWKRVLNQTEARLLFKNDQGELRVDESVLGDSISYIAEGEGDWKITVAKTGDEPPRSFSSTDEVQGFELEIPHPWADDGTADSAAEQSLLSRVIDFISRRHAA